VKNTLLAMGLLVCASPVLFGAPSEGVEPMSTEGWTVTASESPEDAAKAIDRDQQTFWWTDRQAGGEWIAVDFGEPTTVGEIRLLSGHGDGFDWGGNLYWPRGVRVEVSDEGGCWRTILTERDVVPKPGEHVFLPLDEPVTRRLLRITQIGKSDDRWFRWAIHELQIFPQRVSPEEPTGQPVVTIHAGKEIQPIDRKVFGVALHSVKLIATDQCRTTGEFAIRPWTIEWTKPLNLKACRCILDGFNSITAYGPNEDPEAAEKKMMLSIELYARFCEQVGMPVENVIVGLESLNREQIGNQRRTPEWYAKWLEYINCPVDENWNGGVAWAKKRVEAFPHRVEPYGFVHFEGANEPYAGHANNLYRNEGEDKRTVAKRYSDACREIWRTFHETDESGRSLFGPHAIWLPRPDTEAAWGKSFVDSLEGEFDFIVPHVYPQASHFHETEGAYMELSFNPAEYIPRVLERAEASLPDTNKLGKRPYLFLNEWGVEAKRVAGKYQWDWTSTHANALMRVMTMIQFQKRHEELRLFAATNWNLFESSGFGLMPRYDPPSFRWPCYLALEYFNKGVGDIETASVVENSRIGLEMPLIQVLSSLSADRETLYVTVINSYYDQDKDTRFVIEGAEPDTSRPTVHYTLNGDPLKPVIKMADHRELEPTTTVRESRFPTACEFTLPLERHSMNVLQIPLNR